MVVGHFGAALVAKSVRRDIPLWHLFISACLADIVWATLVFSGVESFGFYNDVHSTASQLFVLKLESQPWSHGLFLTMLLAALASILYYRFGRSKSKEVALTIALVIWSHWWLDLVVHRPDLPIFFEFYPKQGWGFWDSKQMSIAIELVVLGLGLFLYGTRTRLLPHLTDPKRLTEIWLGKSRFHLFVVASVVLVIYVNLIKSPCLKIEVKASQATGLLATGCFSNVSCFLLSFVALSLLATWYAFWMDTIRGGNFKGRTYNLPAPTPSPHR